ncbi:hypothetical protein CTAYLR_002242 [Chrysophaeum taylorii]|uniref:Bifunctional lysine-specific demethylase and histidyl-hydroxylase n=1 Tax=Chrysophaeum taylorii TaxID=2483200 RepID=A0AAD7UPF2_9STRA|nr:hypothetical protein CTAYLR_002242 [Chrysophaeum taylorii]
MVLLWLLAAGAGAFVVAPPPRAPRLLGATSVGEEWASRARFEGRRDGDPDVAAAASCRTAMEGLKPALEGVWASGPPLLLRAGEFAGWFGFEALEGACGRGEVGEAGRGVVGAGGSWHMRRVGAKGIPVAWPLIDECLGTHSTVVLNSADARCPRLAALSLAALDAFGLPACLNLYATGAGTRVSAPPHVDKQRVLVLQTEGAKHWRVFAPPDPRAKPASDPLARGKGDDFIAPTELEEPPLVDVVLRPGDVLYVPAGFPHTTATTLEPSLHLTLGLDTHVWGLDPVSARRGALRRAGLPDKLRPELDLEPDVYWGCARGTPPIGWWGTGGLAEFLASAARLMEPGRWTSDSEASAALDAPAVARRLEAHARTLVDIQTALYVDALYRGGGGGPRNVPFEARVAAYYAKMEAAHLDLLKWYDDEGRNDDAAWRPGDAVQALMQGTDDQWFDAVVVDAAHLDATFDVVFFDGELQRAVPADRIRRPRKTTTGGGGVTKKKKSGGFAAAPKKKPKPKSSSSSSRRR